MNKRLFFFIMVVLYINVGTSFAAVSSVEEEFFQACRDGQTEIALKLLQEGKVSTLSRTQKGEFGPDLALTFDHPETALALLEARCRVTNNVFYWACINGRVDILRAIFKRSSYIWKAWEKGVKVALIENHPEVALFLVENKSPVFSDDFFIACKKGFTSVVLKMHEMSRGGLNVPYPSQDSFDNPELFESDLEGLFAPDIAQKYGHTKLALTLLRLRYKVNEQTLLAFDFDSSDFIKVK